MEEENLSCPFLNREDTMIPMMGEEYFPFLLNPDQDVIQAQGVSPCAEYHHLDGILDHFPWRLYTSPEPDPAAVLAELGESWNIQGGAENMYSDDFTHAQSQLPVQMNGYQEHLTNCFPLFGVFGRDEPLADRFVRHDQREQLEALLTDRSPRARSSPSQPGRGGREMGMCLPNDTRVKSQGVREAGGSCMRCWATKERCSINTPCTRCEEQFQKGTCRKWMQCFRSFSDLGGAMMPSMLASRLDVETYESWMARNTKLFKGRVIFELPLHFGFGETFIGFLGSQFLPRKSESVYSYSARPEDGEVKVYTGLPIFATYESRNKVIMSINDWLRDTLKTEDSMRQWRLACFPGEKDIWARDLFETVWQTSQMFWAEKRTQSQTQTDCDEALISAWYMALLAAILSFRISVPLHKLSGVNSTLPSGVWDNLTNSSRAINKGAKTVLFPVYQSLQQKVLAQLDKVLKNSKTMDDRELGTMFCVSTLLVFAINQTQLSLRANYNIAVRDGNDLVDLEKTERELIDLEAAFRAIACSYAKPFRDRNKSPQPFTSHAFAVMEHKVLEIYRKCSNDVRRYRREQIRRNMDTEKWFSSVNRLRLFAWFLQELFPKRKHD